MKIAIIIIFSSMLFLGCKKEDSKHIIKTSLTVHERDGSVQNDYDSFRYFIQTLENDSGYVVNRMFGSLKQNLRIKSLKCASENNDSTVIGTYRYLPTFLYHRAYCKPRSYSVNDIEDEALYYRYESKRNYIVGDQGYDINSYYIDALGDDLGHRLYFSPKIGLVAAFASSWGNSVFYKNEGNKILEELKVKLKADTNFFPIPIETIIPPPKPE